MGKVIDLRKHNGYYGPNGTQEWVETWRSWVNDNVARIERAIAQRDLEEIMQGVAALVYYTRRSWRSSNEFQAQWDVERNALLDVGADEELAFVVYWALHKDSIIYKLYLNIFNSGVEKYIKELYDTGLRMKDIDEKVCAWRPFDCELTGQYKRIGIGIDSISRAAQIRLSMTQNGSLWKPKIPTKHNPVNTDNESNQEE